MPTFSSETPLVSVITPAYNAEKYLAETLESVRAQTYGNVEIIVVDDGSTDGTAQVMAAFEDVRYEHQQNLGAGGPARNRGVALAQGELLAFLDADDLWSPDKLAKQVALYQSLPRSDRPIVIYGHARQFFSPDLDEGSQAHIRLPEGAQAAQLPSTLLITPADFARIGPYGDTFPDGFNWHLQAVEAHAEFHIMPDVMLHRRIHGANQTRTERHNKHEYIRQIKASLDRRRG